jgi:hypothetical protein
VDNDISTNPIFDANILMYGYVSGTLNLIESHTTDMSGRAQFTYIPFETYVFQISADGYDSRNITYAPIIYTTYTIKLTKSAANYPYQDYSTIHLNYQPRYFYNNATTTFTWNITSAYGILNQSGFVLKYPGGTVLFSSGNPNVDYLSTPVVISNANMYDAVNMTYFYKTNFDELRNFSVNMPIVYQINYTMMENQNKTYGLGLFERVFISCIIVIFVAGIASLTGGLLISSFMGILIMGYLMYIGFFPYWSVILPMIIGVMLLIWRVDI